MTFRLSAHRFAFRALDSVWFPPGKAANVLRGALGQLSDFGESPAGHQPGGLADPPRPFVLRAAHLDGKRFAPGETFAFDVHFFDSGGRLCGSFEQAFLELARTGIGPRRGRVELIRPVTASPVTIDLSAGAEPVTAVTVRFRTPTELKGVAGVPFGALLARIRDRISTLRAFYGEGPLPIDFKALAQRADLVETVSCDLQYHEISRRSSRTGAVHGIGGFTGTAEYAGELAEFLPFLRAAWWTGVGRHTVWGNGVIEIAAAR